MAEHEALVQEVARQRGIILELQARVENLEHLVAKVVSAAQHAARDALRDHAAAFAALQEKLEQLEEKVETPDWRERR